MIILWIDKNTKQFFPMEVKPVGEDLLNFDYKVIDEDEYNRLEELKENNTVIYEDGEFKTVNMTVELTKEELIEKIKKEISNIKKERIEKGVEINEGVWHPARDTDKINLNLVLQIIGDGTRKWKCYDNEYNPVLIDINKEMIQRILLMGMELLNGLIIGEAIAYKLLENMEIEELKNIDAESVYNIGIKRVNEGK